MEQKEPGQNIEEAVESEEEMLRNNLKKERNFSSGNISLLILLGAVVDSDQLYRLGVVPFFNSTKGSYLLQYNKDGQLCSLSNLTLEYETKGEDTVG